MAVGSFLYLKGLDDLVVGRRERKWFKHGELGLGKYAKGEGGYPRFTSKHDAWYRALDGVRLKSRHPPR